MDSKENYVIWREKNGFFSAVSKEGEIHTWAMSSGKHLFENKDKDVKEIIEGFEVFKSSEKDTTYTRNFYDGYQSTI